jgi:hypothetical protein
MDVCGFKFYPVASITLQYRFCRLCFIKLNLLLIAIEARTKDKTESSLAINPGPDVKIDSNTQGFFIAESADDVKRYSVNLFIISLF